MSFSWSLAEWKGVRRLSEPGRGQLSRSILEWTCHFVLFIPSPLAFVTPPSHARKDEARRKRTPGMAHTKSTMMKREESNLYTGISGAARSSFHSHLRVSPSASHPHRQTASRHQATTLALILFFLPGSLALSQTTPFQDTDFPHRIFPRWDIHLQQPEKK